MINPTSKLEELLLEIDFSSLASVDPKKFYDMVPVIVQDYSSNEVLTLGYMDREAVWKTIETDRTTYWSRKTKRLRTKGETSGNYQFIREIYYDCDADTLLVKVEQIGNACHTGNRSCFYRKLYEYNKSSD